MIGSISCEKKEMNHQNEAKGVLHFDLDEHTPAIEKDLLLGNRRKFSFNLNTYLVAGMSSSSIHSSHDEKDADSIIENFVRVPIKMESFMFLGFFICLDVFLHTLTFLPIRCILSFYLLGNDLINYVSMNASNVSKSYQFHRNNLYDLMKGLLLVGGCIILCFLDMSRLYHLIRGQTLIKLYVFSSMLEMFDRLLSSFGQDAFTSLYSQTRNEPREKMALFKSFIVVYFYVVIHSILYFIQTAALTVAINSSDQAFLTVVLLNNFTEVKSFVFKKFDKRTLFKLSCADVTERFQMILFFAVIVFAAIMQSDSPWYEVLPGFATITLLLIVGECLADWIKHCFIAKFNSIEAAVYEDYSQTLRSDILQCYEKAVDPTESVSKRIGIAQIPLACVFVRYIAMAAPLCWPWIMQYQPSVVLACLSISFIVLVALKVAVGTGLILFVAGCCTTSQSANTAG